MYVAAAAKSLQSCPTLCDPIDGSPPGSTGPGILQARTLEWVVISFSNAWKWKVKVKSLMGFSRQEYWSGVPLPSPWLKLLLLSHFSRVRLCATPETEAHQAPPSLGFSRQEHWSGLPFPSPEEHCRFLLIFVLSFDLCNSPLKEVLRTNTDSASF